ncbi:MAG: hypothetical protein HOC74_16525 [Gemmatimonadetes bacterium]|jgi:hypothetical protein|nr:hypothetical protein [Gemmatimonadota bacterium]
MSAYSAPQHHLERYEKQVEELVETHRTGNSEAIALICKHLPRLERAAEEAIRQTGISLEEAQQVVARANYFEDWNWLRAISTLDFDLLARLSDREIQLFLRHLDLKDMTLGIKGIEGGAGTKKLLNNLSSRMRIEKEQEVAELTGVGRDECEERREAILKHLMSLAHEGKITWPDGDGVVETRENPPYAPRLVELAGLPLEEMSVDELAEMFAEMATRMQDEGTLSLGGLEDQIASPFVKEGLQLVVDGIDGAQDFLKTRAQFSLVGPVAVRRIMIVEGLMGVLWGDSPRMMHHKLSPFYQREMEAVDIVAVTASELAARLHRTPVERMAFAEVDAFFTDLAGVWRREKVDGLQLLIAATNCPLLRCGLEMICADVDRHEFIEKIEELKAKELGRIEKQYDIVIAGIRAIWDGKTPEETADIVRKVAT